MLFQLQTHCNAVPLVSDDGPNRCRRTGLTVPDATFRVSVRIDSPLRLEASL
jgi:hypothetical protein